MTESPRLTEEPLIVMELFVNDALEMLLKVFVEPEIDLLVNVCEPVKVATVESIAMVTGVEPL